MAANRRPIALAAAVATVCAVGATAFALPAVAADGPPAAQPPIGLKEGTLEWGFVEKFRTYVVGPIGQGSVVVDGGAAQAAGNGAFTFVNGKGTYDMTTHGTRTAFEGGVNFLAHGGVLDLKFTDLKVETTRTGGVITADVRSVAPKGGKEKYVVQNDLALADLDMAGVRPGQGEGGAMVFKGIKTKLTADGAKVFQNYQPGDALDAATLTVKPDTGATKPPVDPTRPPTGDPGQTKPPTTGPGQTKPPTTEPGQTKPPVVPGGTKPPVSPGESVPPVGPPAGAEQGAVVDGNLDWGVLGRFRDYVTGPIAHGKVELSGGAVKSGDGFRFPKGKGTFDAEKQNLSASFDGKVRFLGHLEGGAYTLDLNFSALKVEVKGGKGTLVADVSTKDRATKKIATYKALDIATLTPSGELNVVDGVVKLAGVPAKLTAGGSKAFGGMYEAGQAMDALTVAVSVEKGAVLPGGSAGGAGGTAGGSTGGAGTTGGTGGAGTAGGGSVGGSSVGGGSVGGLGGGSVGGNLAATGSSAPSGALLGAAGALAAAGGAVVFAARKRRTVRGEQG